MLRSYSSFTEFNTSTCPHTTTSFTNPQVPEYEQLCTLLKPNSSLSRSSKLKKSVCEGGSNRLSERRWRIINQIYSVCAKCEWLTEIDSCLCYCFCRSTNSDIYCCTQHHHIIQTGKGVIKPHLWAQTFGYLVLF